MFSVDPVEVGVERLPRQSRGWNPLPPTIPFLRPLRSFAAKLPFDPRPSAQSAVKMLENTGLENTRLTPSPHSLAPRPQRRRVTLPSHSPRISLATRLPVSELLDRSMTPTDLDFQPARGMPRWRQRQCTLPLPEKIRLIGQFVLETRRLESVKKQCKKSATSWSNSSKTGL